MNFILVGHDSASLLFTQGLLARSHCLVAYLETPEDLSAYRFPELEGVRRLSSPEGIMEVGHVDFLVLAGPVAGRADRLRIFLRLDPIDLVLAAPLGAELDICFELAQVREEQNIEAMPLVAELEHPALRTLELWVGEANEVRSAEWRLPLPAGSGPDRFVEGWIWLRRLAGEIVSVSATAASDEPAAIHQIVIAARSQKGWLSTVRMSEGESDARLKIETNDGFIECSLPEMFLGRAVLRRRSNGVDEEITTEPPEIGKRWAERWDRQLQWGDSRRSSNPQESVFAVELQAATRQLEISDAIVRSLRRQRAVSLAYDEVSEETNFKSMMTATGCGLLLAVVFVTVAAALISEIPVLKHLVPAAKYLVLFTLVFFLGAQSLLYVARRPSPKHSDSPPETK